MKTPYDFKFNVNAGSAQTNAAIHTPGTGRSIRLMGMVISNGASANNVTITSGAGNDTQFGPYYFAANGGVSMGSSQNETPILKLAANEVLKWTTTAADDITISGWGYEERE
jgi:hypothetical protein